MRSVPIAVRPRVAGIVATISAAVSTLALTLGPVVVTPNRAQAEPPVPLRQATAVRAVPARVAVPTAHDGTTARADVATAMAATAATATATATGPTAARVGPEALRAFAEVGPLLAAESTYVLVHTAQRRLYLVSGGTVRYSARVAVGRGTPRDGAASAGRFATPFGRFTVSRKDVAPLWVPPDWHYAERARRTGRRLVRLAASDSLRAADGSTYFVAGNDVMRRATDGSSRPADVTPGEELIVDGRIVVPPTHVNQRRYPAVLGTHRLYLGDGYGIHGTTDPRSIGRAVTHGCIRLRNEDIDALFPLVPLGTPVYVR